MANSQSDLWLIQCGGFPDGLVVKNPPANAEDTGLRSGLGRFRMPWSNEAIPPQLPSPHATTPEAQAPTAYALQQKEPLQ